MKYKILSIAADFAYFISICAAGYWTYEAVFGKVDMKSFLEYINFCLPVFIVANCLNFFRKEVAAKEAQNKAEQDTNA